MYKTIAVSLLLTLGACTFAPVSRVAPVTRAPANTPVTLRMNLFRGSANIPIYMAMEKGYFLRRSITPVIEFTPSSEQQRAGLIANKFDIALAAVDNAVAMVEVAGADVIIVAGGDSGMNELMVRQDINSAADLRGRTYVVDAPNTAYALIGRKILKNAGLEDGKDYQLESAGGSEARTKSLDTPAGAATLLNPPWNFIARDRGAKSLGSTIQLYGAYQANGLFVMRDWAAKNPSALERYLAAYIEGCRAALDPNQRELTLQVLSRELKLDRRVAEMTYNALTSAGSGLSKDCAFDMNGFRNVLALRAEIEGQWGGTPPAAEKFLDLHFYQQAMTHSMP